MEVYESPLSKWEGSFELPAFDDVDGTHWNIWRKALEKAPESTLNRRFCFAGLTLIEKAGEWNMKIPMSEVVAWEKSPQDERVRLVSWIGRSLAHYIDELIDPKG